MTPSITQLRPDTWERIVQAVRDVRKRLVRSTRALRLNEIAYAVAGDNAVAAWVRHVDDSAERTAVNVELIIRPSDRDRACEALTHAGFIHRDETGRDLFVDVAELCDRSAVRLISTIDAAGVDGPLSLPDPSESVVLDGFQVLTVEATARREVAVFKTVNKVRLHDLLNVDLIDATWLDRLPPQLAARLKLLIDNPE